MILTGAEITRQHHLGRIIIDPFTPDAVNPNSYNFRLGPVLRVYTAAVLDTRSHNPTTEVRIPETGLTLQPGRLYLGHTIETLGSSHYAPTFAARSSVARLGLFLNLSASLGDIGYVGQWTLQLYALHPITVYPGMPIGQMMWWHPHGQIDPYQGKYQGSTGPTPSAIHLDHVAQPSTALPIEAALPTLDPAAPRSDVGGKASGLAALRDHLPVPPTVVVPVRVFAEALGTERRAALTTIFADLHATIGADAHHRSAQIAETVADLTVPDALRVQIADRLAALNPTNVSTMTYTVRSSAIDEDGHHRSHAGLHNTSLHLAGLDDVTAAVVDCWRSFYAPAAVLARLRDADTDPAPRLAVLIQPMISPIRAGVAFTDGPSRVEIEHVAGPADELMAGIVTGERITTHRAGPLPAPWQQVADLARAARDLTGHDVDIEWAIDTQQRLWLLQCRPVTARLRLARHSTHPIAATAPLYPGPATSVEDLPPDTAVTGIVAGYRRKRGPAYALAQRHGAAVLPGWVVTLNGHALTDPTARANLLATVTGGPGTNVVLDLGDGLRQQIVPKHQLAERLLALLPDDDHGYLHTLVVRAFVTGDLGILATPTENGILIETSPDGLLALNRGTATGSRRITVAALGEDSTAHQSSADEPFTLRPADVATISRVTAALAGTQDDVTAEWTLTSQRLFFIDYSRPDRQHEQPRAAPSRRAISPGHCTGPVLALQDEATDALLTRISVGAAISVNDSTGHGHDWAAELIKRAQRHTRMPVVTARRPYAALSVLIGHVAGFVFQDGAALCHLGILVREAGIPAVLAPELPDSGEIEIHGEDIVARVT